MIIDRQPDLSDKQKVEEFKRSVRFLLDIDEQRSAFLDAIQIWLLHVFVSDWFVCGDYGRNF